MKKFKSVITFDLNSDLIRDDEILHFEGIATKHGLLVDDYAKLTIKDILEQEVDGQWFSVISENNTIKIVGDFYGFSTIFYTSFNNIVAISTHYDALISFLKKNKIDLKLNYAEIYPYFASKHSFFDQGYSCETSCEQIKRINPNNYIEIRGNSYKVLKFNRSLMVNKTYKDLIKIGISKSNINLKNLSRLGYDAIEQSLSGGKDSRCVLALAISANLNKDLAIRTRAKFSDGGKLNSNVIDDDFEIALDLVSTLKLKWTPVREKIGYPISFKESVEDYRFYRSGKYFNFNFTKYAAKLPLKDQYIELAGGCGEVLRGFWADYFRNIRRGEQIKELSKDKLKASNLVFDIIVPKHPKLSQLHAEAKKIFSKEVVDTEGDSFFESIDNHYFNHRNKYHFSNHEYYFKTGMLLYFPLAVKEFYLASKMLPHSERANGRLVFDIISEVDNSLHSFGYESDFKFQYETPEIERSNINVRSEYKRNFLEAENQRKLVSKELYIQPSYNLKLEFDNALWDRYEKCCSDDLIGLIFDQIDLKQKILSSTQVTKVKYFNKMDLINLVIDSESIKYSQIDF